MHCKGSIMWHSSGCSTSSSFCKTISVLQPKEAISYTLCYEIYCTIKFYCLKTCCISCFCSFYCCQLILILFPINSEKECGGYFIQSNQCHLIPVALASTTEANTGFTYFKKNLITWLDWIKNHLVTIEWNEIKKYETVM